MKNKIVFFFVDNYSISFVKTEINFLAKNFKKVVVFCEQNYGELNVLNVDLIIIDYKDYYGKKILLTNLFLFLKLFFTELIYFPKYFFYPKKIASIASNLLRSIYISKQVEKNISSLFTDCVFYTFWLNNWATALSMLVKKNRIPQYYSRVHGTDLYEERVAVFGKIPFRKFQLKHVAKVFSVSKKGEIYLKNKYPKYSKNIGTAYLGTKDFGLGIFNKKNVFTIVSCAQVRNIKRIYLIAEVLMNLDFVVKWIHIGGESTQDPTYPLYLNNINKLSLKKSNVTVQLMGKMTSNEIMSFYKNNSINLFISLSSTEGIPVSMMEALSFGIPILSTDVGGCDEIVTKETGILIPKEFICEEVAKIIFEFSNSEMNNDQFRLNAHKYWSRNFDNNKNGANFIKLIV